MKDVHTKEYVKGSVLMKSTKREHELSEGENSERSEWNARLKKNI
jgi:hypothetical protein